MEVTILVASVAAIIAIIYFIRKVTLGFNERCLRDHGFEPINLTRIAIASTPVFIIVAGFIFDDRSSSYWNIAASIAISIIILWGLFEYIRRKTTQAVAFISLVFLILYGVGFVAVLFILFALYASDRSDDGRPVTQKMGF